MSGQGKPAGRASQPVLEIISPIEAEMAKPPARYARITVPLVFLLLAAMLALGFTVQVDRVVTASGRLVGDRPNVLIQPAEAAIVRSVEVRLNQVVRQGELLARLDPTFSGADLSALLAQERALAAEVARLEAELAEGAYEAGPHPAEALQAAIFAQRRAERQFREEGFRQRARSLEENIQRSEEELRQLQQRAQIAGQIEGMRRELERGQIGSRLNWLIAVDSRLEVQRAIASTEGQIRAAQRDLAAIQADRSSFVGNWQASASQDLALKRRDLSDVRESISKAQLRRDLVEMRAPTDVVVLELGKTSPGAVLALGEVLMTLVPLNSRLEVDMALAPRDLGYVAIGDRAAIKFETFPYVRHGVARGRLTSIGEDTSRPAEGATAPPVYRGRVSIEENELRNLPPDFRLLPGMPVVVDLVVGRRTPMAYLFDRIVPYFVEGMREP